MQSRLKLFNDILTVVVVIIGFYLIATPWIPHIQLWWDQRNKVIASYAGNLVDSDQTPSEPTPEPVTFPSENRLIIPSIALDSEVFAGESETELNKGPWKRPNTSTPDKGSNTVIAGHRFAYGIDGKWIFYHLDKVKVGEKIGLYWQGKEYIYRVSETKVVEATAIEIEDPTAEEQLTLYTCTPIWTAEKRLVVVANLIETNEAPNET